MFFPWSTNLKAYFDQNINDFASAITDEGLAGQRVLVCIETEPNMASIIELKSEKKKSVRDTLETFVNTRFTTSSGITSMLTRIRRLSPTSSYSMIVGCHGMGWLPVEKSSSRKMHREKLHYEYEGVPMTRYFGGLSSEYQIEIADLATSLKAADMKLDYLLFDDCYMSSVEAAYQLRDVTKYLIACPTEVMSYGFPYHKCGKYLLGVPDYGKVCSTFYDFYANYEYPYGTIAVTDCSELDNLAYAVREINRYASLEVYDKSKIQKMDGYSPTIFFDLEDVMLKKCTNANLLAQFKDKLDKTVIHKRHTEQYYAAAKGGGMDITNFCGITTSDGSINSRAATYTETDWYKATH
jgi:hypothetical protein